MKKLLFLSLLLPVIVFAQEKNLLTFSRYFPKADKLASFEKALATHAQKFHKGDVRWAVFTIESVPDVGGYLVAEGPTSWDGLDNRGDISKVHTDDWALNVQPLLTDRIRNDFLVYRLDLSTADFTNVNTKIAINHMYSKPGYFGDIQDMCKELKKGWTDNNQSVAVFEASSSGEPQLVMVTIYKQGLKERETAFRPSLPVTFAKANGGEDAWKRYLERVKMSVNRQWSELLFYKAELSSN